MENVGLDALECLRVKEVAKVLKLSERQVWRLIHRGDIETLKTGSSVRITVPDLAAYQARCRQRAPERSPAADPNAA